MPTLQLHKLMYASQRDSSVFLDIQALVDDAAAFNSTLWVTGVLWYDGKQFVQWLEGTKPALDEVLDRIEAASQHTNIKLAFFEPSDERRYPDWHMTFFGDYNEDAEIMTFLNTAKMAHVEKPAV